MNKVILLDKRPEGKPVLSDFRIVSENIPEPAEGEILLKTHYVSVDPYLRGRMNDSKSYVPPFILHEAIQSSIIAEVLESHNLNFKPGQFITGILSWKEFQVSSGKGLQILPFSDVPISAYLGILGMTGLTAYFGLLKIGIPKAQETLVVSGAAGAVGIVAGQIGKIFNCHVVGITGSEEKEDLLKSKFHFDHTINYKTSMDLNEDIRSVCPQGVDIYFDNVGGKISDQVLKNINKYARIPVCGAISLYNDTNPPLGPYVQPILVTRSAKMQGFIVSDFSEYFLEAQMQLGLWFREGKLVDQETIVRGFDQIPSAFLGLFEGNNQGKMIVEM
jgi:NADPH-dependent curcumin reductase CurA